MFFMVAEMETEKIKAEKISAVRPPLDIVALAKEHAGENYELHAQHINPANVKTLKTIGFDRCYTRAEGRISGT